LVTAARAATNPAAPAAAAATIPAGLCRPAAGPATAVRCVGDGDLACRPCGRAPAGLFAATAAAAAGATAGATAGRFMLVVFVLLLFTRDKDGLLRRS
jgi:hypothetical protein